MSKAAYTNSHIYGSVEKVQAYWDSLKPRSYIAENYVDRWLSQAELFESISLQNRACITLWDAVSSEFVYAVDKTNVLSDYASRFVQPGGIHFSMSNYPTEHLHATLAMQKVAIDYCFQHPEHVREIVMSQDCLYNCGKRQIHFIQQIMVVETDNDFQPVLYLSFLYDISHLKKNSSASLVITSPEETSMWNYNFEKELLEHVPGFSKQETKILKQLASNKSTKEIAGELWLSPHTIDTHRRNLLAKTNCADTTALVTYCKMVGLIY